MKMIIDAKKKIKFLRDLASLLEEVGAEISMEGGVWGEGADQLVIDIETSTGLWDELQFNGSTLTPHKLREKAKEIKENSK